MKVCKTLIRPGGNVRSRNWDVAKRLAAFERMYGGIKVNENWRERYNEVLLQLFGGLDILPFVRISGLNWIGHFNRMVRGSKVNQVFSDNPRGIRLRGRPKNRWWNCVQTDINKCKINKLEKDIKKTELTGRVH